MEEERFLTEELKSISLYYQKYLVLKIFNENKMVHKVLLSTEDFLQNKNVCD